MGISITVKFQASIMDKTTLEAQLSIFPTHETAIFLRMRLEVVGTNSRYDPVQHWPTFQRSPLIVDSDIESEARSQIVSDNEAERKLDTGWGPDDVVWAGYGDCFFVGGKRHPRGLVSLREKGTNDSLSSLPILSHDSMSVREHNKAFAQSHRTTCLTVSSDGRWLATGTSYGAIRVWDMIYPSLMSLVRSLWVNEKKWLAFSSRRGFQQVNSNLPTMKVWSGTGFFRSLRTASTPFLSRGEGWILGPREAGHGTARRMRTEDDDSTLLFVPRNHWQGLSWQAKIVTISGRATELDITRFVHDTDWTQCRRTDAFA